MKKGLAVMLGACVLALASPLALAAPAPMALPLMHAPAGASQPGVQMSDASHVGVRPAVLEIPIPNSMHRALAHPVLTPSIPAAETVQWLTGPVPSHCQHGAAAPSGAHACLVI